MDAMEKIVSLCKRRGFIFPSSEIYGGLNGAWDYGPLGVELKRNLKQAWWDDMVAHHDETAHAAGRTAAVRHGRSRQRAADEPEGLGSERSRRRLQRSDGRRSRDARALSRRSARRVCARVRRRRRRSRALRRGSVRSARRDRQVRSGRALRAASQANRCAAKEQGRQGSATRRGAGRAARRGAARQGARARRIGTRHADGAARIQPDVQDARRCARGQLERHVSAARDGAGHLRQLQERLRHGARARAVRYRPGRQGVSQRDQPAQLHVPQPRVRADGDRVLLPRERRRAVVSSTGASGAIAGISTSASSRRTCICASTRRASSRTMPRAAPTSSTTSRSAAASSRASRTARTSICASTCR